MGQVLNKASIADLRTGTNDALYVTPAGLDDLLEDGSIDVVANSGTFGFGTNEVGVYSLNCYQYGFAYRNDPTFVGWIFRNSVAGWQMSVNVWGDFEIYKNYPGDVVLGFTIYAADRSAVFASTVSSPQGTGGERFGYGSSVGNYSTAIGNSATCTTYGVAVGAQSNSQQAYCISIGYAANAYQNYGIAIGNSSRASYMSLAIGEGAYASSMYSMAIGVLAQTTETHQLVLGGAADANFISKITTSATTLSFNAQLITPSIKAGPYTVGTLPSAAANTGARSYVTDSNLAYNSTNLGSTVTAGGANVVPVFCNGTNWVVG